MIASFWDELAGQWFLGQNEIDKSNQSDAQLKAINDAALARGAITQAEHDQTVTHIDNSSIQKILENPETSIASGFVEGAAEGLRNDASLVGSGLSSLVGSIGYKGWLVLGVAGMVFLAYSGALPSRRR